MSRQRMSRRVEKLSISGLLLCALLLVHLFLAEAVAAVEASSTDRLLSYTIEEESPRGTIVIANLRKDAGLSSKYRPEVVASLRFVFLDKHQPHLGLFSLVEHSGALSTAGLIDREIVCRDLRPRTAECILRFDIAVQPPEFFEVIKVKVVVKDINDNHPVFPVSHVEKQLPESSPYPMELFPVAAATDADGAENGVAEYRLMTDAADKFSLRIDRNSATREFELKLVLTGPIDREERDQYTLSVVAYDGGTPRHSATMSIVIQVTDVNDNNPTFTSALYKVTLPENLTLGSKVVLVKATDPDLGPNGRIRYKISKRSELMYPGTFSMDPETGQLTLSGSLDRERLSSYTLVVSAEDCGENPVPALATVSIAVQDINDNKPEIIVDYMGSDRTRLEIREHAKPRTFVAHVLIMDPDEGPNGRVECVLAGGDQNLVLEPTDDKEFRILTARVFDREAEQVVASTLSCCDLGRPVGLTSTREIQVWVVDLDDNVPQFTHPVYYASLVENNLAFVDILNVSVIDADSAATADGRFLYALDDRAEGGFEVGRRTGLIRATRSFDREETDCAEFGVTATDDEGSFHASAVVRVHIVDVDDEAPVFNGSVPYGFEVAENAPSKTEVGRVEAVDRDLWPHNQTWYELDPETSYGDFDIDPLTGTIYTNGRLDREVRDRYIMTAVAQSRGSLVMRSDSVSVFVRVSDCNDNAPVILSPSGVNDTIRIPTNLPAGGLVTSIVAYDSDVGGNGLLRYGLARESDFFTVVPETGKVFLRRVPPENSSHLLEVIVADGGVPSLSASVMLSVLVTDEGASPGETQQVVDDALIRGGGSVLGGNMLVLAGVVSGCVAAAALLTVAVLFAWQRFGRQGKYPTSNISNSSRHRNTKSELIWSIVRSVSSETNNTNRCGSGNHEEGVERESRVSSPTIQKLDYEPGRQRWNPVFDGDSGLDVMTTSVTSHGSSVDDCESAGNCRRPVKPILAGQSNSACMTDSRYLNPSGGPSHVADDDCYFPPPPTSLLFQNPPSDVSTFRPISLPRSCSVDHNCCSHSTTPPVFSRLSCTSPPLPIPTCPTMFLPGTPLPSTVQVRYPQQGFVPRSVSYGSRKSVRFADEDV